MHTVNQLIHDLRCLGLSGGDTVMVHSSYKSLGGIEDGAAGVFRAFDEVLGEDGTLMLPGFSYDTVTYENPVFDRQKTPVCVSYLPEYFRTQVPGVIRSMHATHSCLLKGKRAEEMIRGHELDLTPVGSHSPLRRLPELDGKILFLGCSSDHNTLCHGVEETAEPPYLLDHDRMIHYTLMDGETVIEQTALHHSFQKDGWFYEQRYSRIISCLTADEYRHGKVLDADCWLLSAKAVWTKGHDMLVKDPFYFVEPKKL